MIYRIDSQINIENELLKNLGRIHTTPMGAERIRRNLALGDDVQDIVTWCKMRIESPEAAIMHTGKNWYCSAGGCIITVNAYSYTIITAHKGSYEPATVQRN